MKYTLFLVPFFAAIISASVIPRQCQEEDDCYEERLHPRLPASALPKRLLNNEDTNAFWIAAGQRFVAGRRSRNVNTNIAKNVILFLGDGMGATTITAARIYAGGEEKQLSFEKFPYTGLAKTYSLDRMVPDSANTATAYLCGIKGFYGTIGVNGKVLRSDCDANKDKSNFAYSAAKWAMDAGKAAGFVTTTRVTHASPAGVYAHIADREWEFDNKINKDCGERSGIPDIAEQLIHGETGSKLKVMMGGGRSNFMNTTSGGNRVDGKNLIDEYLQQGIRNAYLENRQQLLNLNLSVTDRLLGIFDDSHMKYFVDAGPGSDQPSLAEMTQKAIEFLQNEEEGYFLFIEGGKIDKAHHDNQVTTAMEEVIQFSKAIELARNITSEQDTLIIVTADHSHSFSVAGYAARGSPITAVGTSKAKDGLPLLTASYSNGPGFYQYYDTEKNTRIDPTKVDKADPHTRFPSTVYLESETHGGEDVPVYASGPWAHLFTGVYEQNAIPHMYAYASCIGDGLKAC